MVEQPRVDTIPTYLMMYPSKLYPKMYNSSKMSAEALRRVYKQLNRPDMLEAVETLKLNEVLQYGRGSLIIRIL